MFDISLNLIDSSTKLARSAKTPTKPKKFSIKLDSLSLKPKEKSLTFISDTSSEEDDEAPEWKKRLEDKLQKLKERKLNELEEEDKENCLATEIESASTKKVEKAGDSDLSLNLVMETSEMDKTPKSKEFIESSEEDSSEELNRESTAKCKEGVETANRKRKAVESDNENAKPITDESSVVEAKSTKKSVKRVKKKKPEEAKGDRPIIEEEKFGDDHSTVGEKVTNIGKKTAVKRRKMVEKKHSTAKASSANEEEEQVAAEGDVSVDKEVDFEDGNKPATSTKERTQNSSLSDEVTEARLARLRKYAHHAGLIPPYKKLFAGLEKTSKKIKILSDFLVEKGIQKPLSLKSCAEYKIRRENEREKEALAMNTIFEGVSGGRVTRSSRHKAVVKRLSRAAIEDSESESENDNEANDEQNTNENQSMFSGLAGIVSSDDED